MVIGHTFSRAKILKSHFVLTSFMKGNSSQDCVSVLALVPEQWSRGRMDGTELHIGLFNSLLNLVFVLSSTAPDGMKTILLERLVSRAFPVLELSFDSGSSDMISRYVL